MEEQLEQTKIQIKKKKKQLRPLLYFFIIAVVLLVVWAWQAVYLAPGGSEAARKVIIGRGDGLSEIADSLKGAGLIKSKLLFETYTVIKGKHNHLKAGVYELLPNKNMPALLAILVSGEIAKETITIIEGWNLRDIAWYFENKGMFQAEELFELVGFPAVDPSQAAELPLPKDFSEEFEFLKEKPAGISLEGYLFPDTYEITHDISLEGIVRKCLENFGRQIRGLREEIAKQNKTLLEVLTMASLLEKEIRTLEDKQMVAGILWKRLRYNWLLQVDATITYLTDKSSSQLTKEDLAIDSAYNTYKYYGLPPGPICNPGLESIEAAVYYEDSDYWFYLTTAEGEAVFSKTLREHNIAKYEYLK